MYKGKKTVAIIPARGGSTRLPRKNIRPMGNKPMISHCICKALAMEEIDVVVVSTDDQEIARIASQYGAQVPFMRKKHLAQSDTPIVLVIEDAIRRLEAERNYDYILLLQANSPLTRIEDMRTVVRRAIDEDLDVIFTVMEASHPPQWSLRLQDGRPSFAFWEDDGRPLDRTQDEEVLYRSTGAAVALNISYFLENMNTMRLCFGAPGQNTGVVITDAMSAIDIDTEFDYIVAQAIYGHNILR